jgi:hypothetical protein
MQQTIGLAGALVDGHTGTEKVFTELDKLNAELGCRGIDVDAVEHFN